MANAVADGVCVGVGVGVAIGVGVNIAVALNSGGNVVRCARG